MIRWRRKPKWASALRTLAARIDAIVPQDEAALRSAVTDLRQLVGETDDAALDAAVLTLCGRLWRLSLEPPEGMDEPLPEAFHNKGHIRSLNTLIRALLPNAPANGEGLFLAGARLQRLKLPHIGLTAAVLRHCDLSHSNLNHARLCRADLAMANLMSARLNHAELRGAHMERCELGWGELAHADLSWCQLIDSEMEGAVADHARLEGAVLAGANLASASLQHADLSRANLFGANLHESRLQGAILTGTGITPERLGGARMRFVADSGTVWGCDKDYGGRNPLAGADGA